MKIKIKITSTELSALISLHNALLTYYSPCGFGNILTREVLLEFTAHLESRYSAIGRKSTITFTASQALAFVGYWGIENLSHLPYENALIFRIISEIDKHRANATIHN